MIDVTDSAFDTSTGGLDDRSVVPIRGEVDVAGRVDTGVRFATGYCSCSVIRTYCCDVGGWCMKSDSLP
jgi:hypothetical protein